MEEQKERNKGEKFDEWFGREKKEDRDWKYLGKDLSN